MATDPACGMTVNEATALRADRDGQPFFFCSEHCRRTFLAGGPAGVPAAPADAHGHHRAEPTPPASPAPVPPTAGVDKGAVYTCPMHPQVEQVGPGTCPICGMALEPKAAHAGGQADDPELTDMTRRLRVAAVLTAPLLLLAMLPMTGVPPERGPGAGVQGWLQLLLSTPVVLWAGWPFF